MAIDVITPRMIWEWAKKHGFEDMPICIPSYNEVEKPEFAYVEDFDLENDRFGDFIGMV